MEATTSYILQVLLQASVHHGSVCWRLHAVGFGVGAVGVGTVLRCSSSGYSVPVMFALLEQVRHMREEREYDSAHNFALIAWRQ